MPESLNETISNLCTTMKLRTQDILIKIYSIIYDSTSISTYEWTFIINDYLKSFFGIVNNAKHVDN